MLKQIGQFAVRYSTDLKQVIIAFTPRTSCLSAHLALCNRLKGIAKPTGDYSRVTFNDNEYWGVHFENNIPEDVLMLALGD